MGEKGGAREGAGRKSARDERIKNLVIQKSWEKLAGIVDKLDSKEDIKNFCLAIGLKDMASKIGNADGSNIEALSSLEKNLKKIANAD